MELQQSQNPIRENYHKLKTPPSFLASAQMGPNISTCNLKLKTQNLKLRTSLPACKLPLQRRGLRPNP